MENLQNRQLVVRGSPDLDQTGRQYLTFKLGSDLLGVEVLQIKEIIEFSQLTHVPMVPDYVKGVINLRGNVVPVIDLWKIFSGKESDVTRRSCIIIVENESDEGALEETGIFVDSVNEVVEIDAENIEPAPSFGTRIHTEFISGMGKIGDDLIILLNLKLLLSFDELADLSGIDFHSLMEGKKESGDS